MEVRLCFTREKEKGEIVSYIAYFLYLISGLIGLFAWYCFISVYVFNVKIITFIVALITAPLVACFEPLYIIAYLFNNNLDNKIFTICLYSVGFLVVALLVGFIGMLFKRK